MTTATVGVDKTDRIMNGQQSAIGVDSISQTKSDWTMNDGEESNDDDVPTGPSSQERPFPSRSSSRGSLGENGTKRDKGNDASETGTESVAEPTQSYCGHRIRRVCKYIVSHWPRTIAVLSRYCLLWMLICWSLAFGSLLATLEAPQEVSANDAIVASAFFVSNFPLSQTEEALSWMPTTCTIKFLAAYRERGVDLGLVILSNGESNVNFNGTNFTSDSVPYEDFLNAYYPQFSLPNVTVKDNPSFQDFFGYLEECQESASVLIGALIEDRLQWAQNVATANSSLTFNWIRCWNASDPALGIDRSPWIPNQAQVNASANQSAFFRQTWYQNQASLQEHYEEEWNCTGNEQNKTQCIFDARKVSAQSASGGSGCGDNTGASAWFWFTVMTTVGYGNQSPVTMGGRALVSGLGWLSVMAFGGLTVVASRVLTTIIDDFFRRIKFQRISRPSIATPFWGLAAVGWIAYIAESARLWWTERIPGYEFTKADSYWFAYISALTVGLGDFYLQPQGFYAGDVFSWASRMLAAFVILSTFLGKASDLINNLFPQNTESLADYLARTDAWGNPIDVLPSRSLKTLEALLEQEKSFGAYVAEDSEGSQAVVADHSRIQVLAKKRHALIELLEDTQDELDGLTVTADEGFSKDVMSDVKLKNATDLGYEEKVLGVLLQRAREEKALVESSGMESGGEIISD